MTFVNRRRKECDDGTLDQWFTKPTHLQHYASVIERFAKGKTFVDSSCGTGELGLFLSKIGMEVLMFDIDDSNLAPAVTEAIRVGDIGFESKSWLDVTAEDLKGKEFVMGFNPPFGHKGKVSRQFAEHALSIGSTMICWVSPNIMGTGGRQWVPPDFVERHRENVPSGAFSKNGTTMSANTNFVIFEKDPLAHARLLEEWKVEDARPLPEGWYLERLSARLGGTVTPAPIEDFPRKEEEFLIRTSLSNAGSSGLAWSAKHGYQRFNSNGHSSPVDSEGKQSVTQHCIIGLPPRYSGPRRMDFLKLAAPMFKARRRRACNKAGINLFDIRKVIFELERSAQPNKK